MTDINLIKTGKWLYNPNTKVLEIFDLEMNSIRKLKKEKLENDYLKL